MPRYFSPRAILSTTKPIRATAAPPATVRLGAAGEKRNTLAEFHHAGGVRPGVTAQSIQSAGLTLWKIVCSRRCRRSNMKRTFLVVAFALMTLAPMSASAAVRVFVGGGYGWYAPYWGPYWGI